MKNFIIEFMYSLPLLIIPFMWGFDDGKMKRNATEAHWPKYPIFVCMIILGLFEYSILTLLTWMILVWKPLFDWGWSKGYGFRNIYVGFTSWTDRAVLKVIPKKFIPLVYFLVAGTGIMLMYHFQFRY